MFPLSPFIVPGGARAFPGMTLEGLELEGAPAAGTGEGMARPLPLVFADRGALLAGVDDETGVTGTPPPG
jgi:hypothetical protein